MSMSEYIRHAGSLAACALLALGLAACTTVEGTNALVDAGTFEREVATETLKGLGVIGREKKEVIRTPRGRLVLPKDDDNLPAPREAQYADLLPEDSDIVQIDTSNLSEADLTRLRNARVFDGRTLGGRKLTEEESRKLTARMNASIIQEGRGKSPLWLPPDKYYTVVNGKDAVCLATSGDLVPINDPACPAAIRASLTNR